MAVPGRSHPALLAVLALAAFEARAEAASLTLISRTYYQGSQIRLFDSANIDAFRDLNRFAEWLDVSGWSMGPSGQFDAVVSIRYRTDFGTGFHRDTPTGLGIPAVDGRDDLEMPYAYLDWKNVVEDRLDLRIGRQLLTDDLDWFSLDGVKATLWLDLARENQVEIYVGMPVPYDTFLSSEPFLYDGTQILDGPSLTFGGAGHFKLGEDFSASLAYRHTFIFRGTDLDGAARAVISDTDPREAPLVEAVSGGKVGVNEASLGLSLGYIIRPLNTDVYAHGVYSFLFGSLDRARVGASFTPIESVHAQIEYLRVQPRFAADSIFNYFNIKPYDRGRLELALELWGGLWIEAGYFLHIVNGAPKGPTLGPGVSQAEGAEFKGSDAAHGPSAGVEYRGNGWGAGVTFETSTNFGGNYAYGGNYRMIEGFGRMSFLEDRLSANIRLNYTGAQTDWFEGIDSGAVAPEIQSFGTALGVRVRVLDAITARVDFIKNFGAVLEGSYRLQTMLEVRY